MAAVVTSGPSSIVAKVEESKRPDPRTTSPSAAKVAPMVKKILVEIRGTLTYENNLKQDMKAIGIKPLEKRTTTNLDDLLKVLNPGKAGVLVYENGKPKALQMLTDLHKQFVDEGTSQVAWTKDGNLNIIEGSISLKALPLEAYKNLCAAALKV